MSDESPIVSHVASKEYRENVDAMTCLRPGCRRWRIDGRSPFCGIHDEINRIGRAERLEDVEVGRRTQGTP